MTTSIDELYSLRTIQDMCSILGVNKWFLLDQLSIEWDRDPSVYHGMCVVLGQQALALESADLLFSASLRIRWLSTTYLTSHPIR